MFSSAAQQQYHQSQDRACQKFFIFAVPSFAMRAQQG